MKPKKRVYLDYAAATPLDDKVLAAMLPYQTNAFYNPSSLYFNARETKKDLEAARAKIAKILGAKPAEIIFTSGATESVNLAIMGIAGMHSGKKIVASAIEHHAVLGCLEALNAQGSKTELAPVSPKGIIKIDELEKAIDDDTVLVSVAYANNELGTIQPIRKISQLIAGIRRVRQVSGNSLPLYLHTDATQAAGYLSLAVDSLGADLLTIGGSKIYGPAGSGVLFVRMGTSPSPSQGTANVGTAVGIAAALELAQQNRVAEGARLTIFRDELTAELLKLKGIILNGEASRRLPNFVNISVGGFNGETLILYLDEAGFEVSTGAACTIGRAEPSHVLLALGLSKDQANSSLRITLGKHATRQDISQFIKAFQTVLKKLSTRDD